MKKEQKLAIFKLHFDCGRQGELTGVFTSTKERVNKLIKEKIPVYFGEVLGKHSEIYGPIEEVDVTFVTDNDEAVKVVRDNGLSTGISPFDYTTINFEIEGEDMDDMYLDEVIDILLKKEKKGE